MNKRNWRSNARYVDQYPAEEPFSPVITHRKRNHKPFYNCEKYICTHKRTGSKTCGIIFTNGKVRIGTDVWRLSCISDNCDYPVIGYNTRTDAEKDYDFAEANSPLLFYLTEDNNPTKDNEEVLLV